MNYGNLAGAGQAAAGVGYANPEKQNPIEQRLQEAFRNMEDIRSIVAGFQVGLQTVLTPEMKDVASGTTPAVPRPVAAPMADRLDELNAGLVNSISLLRSIHSRIAL